MNSMLLTTIGIRPSQFNSYFFYSNSNSYRFGILTILEVNKFIYNMYLQAKVHLDYFEADCIKLAERKSLKYEYVS